MLFDTDVLIWVLRGNRAAADLIDATEHRHLSVVTYMELVQGARNRRELKTIKNFLTDQRLQTVPLTENIGHRASIYLEEYALKVGMCLADALVAATAVESQLTLSTANRKHYRPIRELDIRLFRP
jgi:hypothetical protein